MAGKITEQELDPNFLRRITYEIKDQSFIATSNQTIFNLTNGSYTTGTNSLFVVIGGVTQSFDAYTETTSTQFVLSEGCTVGEEVFVYWYSNISILNNITSARSSLIKGINFSSLGSRLESIESGMYVNVKDFGAKGDGVTDDTVAIQDAINFANTSKIRVILFSQGTYIVSQKITLHRGCVIQGVSQYSCVIKSASTFTGDSMFESLGQYLSEGSDVVALICIKDIILDGNSVCKKGWYCKGGYKLLISYVKFQYFVEEFLYFDQVFDSWIDKTYFINTAGTDTSKGVVTLNYGNGDNTNEIHFYGCVWEHFQRPALKIVSGSNSGEQNNEIKFTQCKWESIYNVSHIVANKVSGLSFVQCNWAIQKTNSLTAYYGLDLDACTDVSILSSEIEWFGSGTYTHPFIYCANICLNISVVFSKMLLFSANQSGIYPIQVSSNTNYINTYGTSMQNTPLNQLTNEDGTGLNNFSNSIRIAGKAESTLNLVRDDGTIYANWYLGRMNTNGDFRFMSGNTDVLLLERTTNKIIPKFGLYMDGNFDGSSLLQLGNYRLWVSSTGKLYMKNGIPTSETDGTVVGTQT